MMAVGDPFNEVDSLGCVFLNVLECGECRSVVCDSKPQDSYLVSVGDGVFIR